MLNWFETGIKYEKTAEEGKIVKVSEKYLVDALSFTEAEARINEEMKPFISGEFVVDTIKRAKINELFPNESGDKWFKSKVFFVSLDEEKGVEKRTPCTMYVQANDIKEAEANLKEGMKGTMADYEIASITETKILDVFNYKTEEKAKIAKPDSTEEPTSEIEQRMLLSAAVAIIENQSGSISCIQRKLSVGYNRANRIMEKLEAIGIVGKFTGTESRKILVSVEELNSLIF